MSDEELREKIGAYDAILIRSATKMTPELIDLATNLKVIGRAGTGVDNVDIPAATRRGIIVANAPESNSVAAAEHTLALALALFRNVPQAHASLVAGRWDRAKFKGAELYGKTLGVVGFGRIGQLVAKRAQSFEMEVVAFDKFVSAERFRELGVEGRRQPRGAARPRRPGHPARAEDAGDDRPDRRRGDRRDEGRAPAWSTAPAASWSTSTRCSPGWSPASWPAPRSTSSPSEPFTEHPIFAREDVVVTPHLGASTAEAQDRAGVVTAEQVTAALNGGVVTNAVNIAAVRPEAMEALAPVRAALRKARPPRRRASATARSTASPPSSAAASPPTTPACSGSPSWPASSPATPRSRSTWSTRRRWPRSAGSSWSRPRTPAPSDFTELVTVRVGSGDDEVEVAGTSVGPRNEPYLVSVWGESFYLPFAEHITVFRYADQPGMIGRVGTMFGEEGVNIVSAAVGAEQGGEQRGDGADHRRPGARRDDREDPRRSTASPSAARSIS